MENVTRQKKSGMVTLGFTASLAAALACSNGPAQLPDPEYSRICVDQATNVRLEDERCGDEDNNGGSGGHWYFYPRGSHPGPPVGGSITRNFGSYAKPGSGVMYSVPKTGGFGGFRVGSIGG